MILAADIGGTNTRLAVAQPDGSLDAVREYRSQDQPDLQAIVKTYLTETNAGKVDRACFGVAGPVKGEPGKTYSRITNLTWTVEQVAMAYALGVPANRVK